MSTAPAPEGADLLAAIAGGDLARVAAEIERLGPDWRDEEGCGALWHALARRQWPVAELLPGLGVDVDQPDWHGWTPLFWAVFNGYEDCVDFLLTRGADPDRRNDDGEWPLFWAVYHNRPALVRRLLAAGARADLVDQEGRDVRWLAGLLGHQALLPLLRG